MEVWKKVSIAAVTITAGRRGDIGELQSRAGTSRLRKIAVLR